MVPDPDQIDLDLDDTTYENTDDFESFDDVDSDAAQADLPDDSFDAAAADFTSEGDH